ncbi:ZNF782 [Branchiostoma lanceolatum]|uniref:ZNF782 protein n=1 Tax=Branchiostoma lanceolatum TaxID=7740 RepID=A0A8J9YV94_BRALA|nr:ZNF782 [Branchiostoma lanceolatum]
MTMMHNIKANIGPSRSSQERNFAVLKEVFTFYIQHHSPSTFSQMAEGGASPSFPSMEMKKEDSTQQIVLLTPKKVTDLLALTEVHLRTCRGSVHMEEDIGMDGHVGICTFLCTACPWSGRWNTSPKLPNNRFLVNDRMLHGSFTSGILTIQYEKLCSAANIGVVKEEDKNVVLDEYKVVVEELAAESMDNALEEEITGSVLAEDDENFHGIKVLSDARHCWRKNAYNSDVVFLGHITHRVIRHVLVTKEDEPVSQNHETFGTRRFYEWADARGLSIHLHGHDRNMSVNSLVKERQYTDNGNDTWHATKNLAKSFAKVAKGTIVNRGRTWHPELSDKGAGVKTHFYWSMKTCNGDPDLLQSRLDNIVRHYQNDHRNCFAGNGQYRGARCRTDPNYLPQRTTLRDPVAIQLMTQWIRDTQIYKNPLDYVHCVDTHYVESFNNSLLQYHDKRIVFGKDQYSMRSYLAVLDWNEHVDREYTSITRRQSATNPRAVEGHKVLKRKGNNFKATIWDTFMDTIFPAVN